MKKMGFSVLGLALISSLVACPAPVTPPAQVADGSPISGTISNWIAGKTGTLYARVFSPSSSPSTSAGVTIAADGSFSNLVLPTPTAAELGDSASGLGSCSGGNVIVTPNDGKAVSALLTTTLNASSNGGAVYQANKSQSSALFLDPGSNNTLRIYVNKDATINGSCTTTTGTPKYTYTYNNLSLAQGWNIVNVSVAPHASNSTDPILETFTSGAVASDVKFFQVLPETSNITQSRIDYAKKLSIKWDAVPDATGYTLEFKASSASQYSAPITVAGNQAEIPGLTPNTNYDVRVKTLFGTNSSFGTNSFGFSTATLNANGLNILFPTQDIPNPVSIAAGASKAIALEFERGANCTQALNLSIDGNGTSPVGAASSTNISGVFTPNATTGNSSSLTLTVGSSVAAGTYDVNVNADGCLTSVSTRISLTIP